MSKTRDMTFVLFSKRDRRGKQPNCEGEARINGEVYKLAGWTKESEKAGKYISGTVKAAQGDTEVGQGEKS